MKNNYWEKRAAQRVIDTVKDADEVSQELASIYHKSSRYLSLKADDIFERFQNKHGLSEAEARRLLSKCYDRTSLDELLRVLEEEKKKDVLAELESAAYQARLERLRQLQNELDYVMKNVYHQEKQMTTSFYTDLAKESFYKSMFDIQQRAGLGFDFSHISKKQIDKVLSSKWSGTNYSTRIWNNTRQLAQDLKEELLINLITGRSNREAAELIANKFASGTSVARRLVHTESNFISSEMNFEAYKEAGIEKYQFLATLDLRTSELCRALDGKEFPVSERKVGVNCNPMHPWCRSTTVAVIDGVAMEYMTRSATDPEIGEAIKVPQSMTYEQWYDKFVKGNTKAEINEKKLKNKASDEKQYKEYRKTLGKNVPDKLEEFQDMKYNDTESWNYTKGLKEYLEKYPNSDKRFYDVQEELKELGIKIGIPLPPVKKQAFIIPEGKHDPYHIMKRMLERQITDDELRSYMNDASCMFAQWNGTRQRFVGKEGMVVITKADNEWIYKTAWKKADYDDDALKVLEVLKKHGI